MTVYRKKRWKERNSLTMSPILHIPTRYIIYCAKNVWLRFRRINVLSGGCAVNWIKSNSTMRVFVAKKQVVESRVSSLTWITYTRHMIENEDCCSVISCVNWTFDVCECSARNHTYFIFKHDPFIYSFCAHIFLYGWIFSFPPPNGKMKYLPVDRISLIKTPLQLDTSITWTENVNFVSRRKLLALPEAFITFLTVFSLGFRAFNINGAESNVSSVLSDISNTPGLAMTVTNFLFIFLTFSSMLMPHV